MSDYESITELLSVTAATSGLSEDWMLHLRKFWDDSAYSLRYSYSLQLLRWVPRRKTRFRDRPGHWETFKEIPFDWTLPSEFELDHYWIPQLVATAKLVERDEKTA